MLLRCLLAEFLGTAFLLMVVVGSGSLMHKLDAGNVAITVFGVAVATGLILYALIEMFGSISAHFNPIVTIVNALRANIRWTTAILYIGGQVLGAVAGVMLANLMFDGAAITISTQARSGLGQWLGEVVATFGLIGVITGCSRFKPSSVPQAVSAFVAGAIMFTSSTCFANPAVTISRMFTSTITGIQPADVAAFIASQLVGATLALLVFDWLFRVTKEQSFAKTDEYTVTEVQPAIEKELTLAR